MQNIPRDNFDTFVFGVPRSGTTLLYRLLQDVYSFKFDKYSCTYEPYIWGESLWNKTYDDCSSFFGKTASLNIDGIHAHQHTPLFINEYYDSSMNQHSFYAKFVQKEQPHLVKFIRANGRMRLFRDINPTAKFIYVLRNPLDVINSVKNKFCLFGSDFFPSDWTRFKREIQIDERVSKSLSGDMTWAERNALYWYAMNKAALDFALNDRNTLILSQEDIVESPSLVLARICNFLGLSARVDWLKKIKQPIGPVTGNVSLSIAEINHIEPFDEIYTDLLKHACMHRSQQSINKVSHYRQYATHIDYDESLEGYVTNPLRRMLRSCQNSLRSYEVNSFDKINSKNDQIQKQKIHVQNTRLFPKTLGANNVGLSGIAKRCDWVIVTDGHGDQFSYVLHGDIESSPETVFVSLRSGFTALKIFNQEFLPKIKKPFVLISGSEDITVPNQSDTRWAYFNIEQKKLINDMLDHPQLAHWYTENRDQNHPKLSSLPLGYVFSEPSSEIIDIVENPKPISQRETRFLCAHRVRSGEQWETRRQFSMLCKNQLKAHSTVIDEELPLEDFIQQIRSHAFVACVSGGGLDPSPKAWLTLANGSIPIIKSSALDDAYRKLPVMIVDDWTVHNLSAHQLEFWRAYLAPWFEQPELRADVIKRLGIDFWWDEIMASLEQHKALRDIS